MLTQNNIDTLKYKIDIGEKAEVYYIAHMIEGREIGTLDEFTYKGISDFKIIKIEIEDIQNAYFEYLNYENNKSTDYHIEEEECYYNPIKDSAGEYEKYIHKFIVPNGESSYTKDLNARMPSIIYGYTRTITLNGEEKTITDPSPVKPVYKQSKEHGFVVDSDYNLDWKYKHLDPAAIVDGIEFDYITSDWYILSLKNYPMIEKPLINVKDHSAYFMNLEDAFSYLEQLKA
jgi:hypothetical protein